MSGKIIKVSGPTAQADGMRGRFMHEVVQIGNEKLLGEIIRLEADTASVQVYEETVGLRIGDPVTGTGHPLTAELGPGLLGSIFDGIQRPLPMLAEKWGDFVKRGATVPSIDRERKWYFTPVAKVGDEVSEGMVVGTVQETPRILHKIMVPQGIRGRIKKIEEGEFTVTDTVALLEDGTSLTMLVKNGIRVPRKTAGKLPFEVPMVTGQRILDTLFPVAEGGSAIIPGGFGTGKTVLEQTIAKYAFADVIIYIGCGERGNEMADVLHEFPELKDPYSGGTLMERTVLIANTSNMPVAAREASIYTAMTMAEYYRDMGLRVAVMADSTSRWAEALREISSRMEEMPGEEGHPPYLASRLGAFYERAARVRCLGRPNEVGAITVIGAVSPPGGDFSEPVTQASMRMAGAFWALDYALAHSRHFPAISWLSSFSLSQETLAPWYVEHANEKWMEMVGDLNALLQREDELSEVVKIVGLDAMGERERVEMESAAIMREGYLRQNSYSETDAFCPIPKQSRLLSLLLLYAEGLRTAQANGRSMDELLTAPMRERIMRIKDVGDDLFNSKADELEKDIRSFFGLKDA